MKPIRVIGIGNNMAGDDALGPLTIQAMKAKPLDDVELIEAGMSGLRILDVMKGADVVILIDAVRSGRIPGTIHRLVIPDDLGLLKQSAWNSGATSTHGFGLGETLTLSHTLGTLPPNTLVYGIELSHTNIGTDVSSSVKKAIQSVVSTIKKDVEAYLCMNSNS
ncbi:hydrogenase maturation protease [Candidatus Nitronereus thalassa]|uniref:Hydrogenase maturation protease n=1 Tax=Candidatus Nitronereus thalassa TaxID=3020898 RepID=A0ABU3K8R0_9BACT|nr:hydrogenase maturation protease [Candidatus Nitronereus thalassa]MDT7042835.1 hydrogenase maturation protease [Candidatus Nitronereus thalassa]